MPEFLELVPPLEALSIFEENLPEHFLQTECIDTHNAVGRVVALQVLSKENLPAFSRSTVDGYAVCASDTHGASESLPVYLTICGEIPMGKPAGLVLHSGEAALIHTGGMLPEGADAVVMIEHTQEARSGEVEVLQSVGAGENVLKVGEDVSIGDEIIPLGRKIRPVEVGGLLALGITDIEVAKKPRVGIISSGDEVVSPYNVPTPGQVRDVNSYSLGALISSKGAEPVRYGIVSDNFDDMKNIASKALRECDAVVITAGSSASVRDLTSAVIQELGSPGVLVHGVNVKPGKPTILAVCDGKPVVGLPGNPVSAIVIADIFVTWVIEYLLGIERPRFQTSINAKLTVNVASVAGREDWMPVQLTSLKDDEIYQALPIFYKSNLILKLVNADGLAKIPADANGLSAGDIVEVKLI